MKTFTLVFIGLLFYFFPINGQVSFGDSEKINGQWKFQKGDFEDAFDPGFDDSQWRTLDLPHDWSVEGPYSPDLASATGYLPGGIGWYRKDIHISEENEGERIYIYFEGVYRDGEVFINGESLGMRPNGYISYMYDLTPYITYGENNTIAVRVDHSQHADSRWYTGSGIYRDVYLIYANPVHINQWGIFYTTPEVNDEEALVSVQSSVNNTTNHRVRITVKHEIVDDDNNLISQTQQTVRVAAGSVQDLNQEMTVQKPLLWSVDQPNLYELKTSVFEGDDLIDHSITNLGIRTLDFDSDNGFSLNGENMNLKGVCLHHDAGSLGAAVPREVWKRRLINLKKLGTNAIRTSHNPQAPDLYELCDELGILVINEVFDEWEYPKKKWLDGWNVGTPGFQGHAAFFEEWGEQDLRDVILRDRNHPSVIMWSIGNEVDYPNDPYSHPILDEESIQQQHTQGYLPDQPNAERLGVISKRLAQVVRNHDTSRPVTAGLAGPVMSNETDYPQNLDVVGYNYTERRYEQDHATYPDRVLYGSENGHSYDAWKVVRDNDYIFGQFLWTGINYLGESHRWPSRGFTSGLLDLGGFIKPRGESRRSMWTDDPMIYIGTYEMTDRRRFSVDALPLWNYDKDDNIRVVAYTNCDSVQILLNGEVVGKTKPFDDNRGMIYWDMPFSAGELSAVAYKDGKEAATHSIQTSNQPYAIRASLWSDGNTISSQRGVAQIEIQIVDKDGVPVIISDNEITCHVDGPARLLSLEASNPHDMGNYNNNKLKVYQGKMIAYVQATGEAGKVRVHFSSPWLEAGAVEFEIK